VKLYAWGSSLPGVKRSAARNAGRGQDLCLACGLCCNGAIFGDVRLQPGDPALLLARLAAEVGAPPRRATRPPQRYRQPCVFFDGCRCRIYAERPGHCRKFDCLLLQSLQAGETTLAAARRTVHRARRQMAQVRRLLRRLGDHDETVALARRFRRVARRLHEHAPDPATARTYGELTLAFHDLNCLLSQSFYPGSLAP